MKNGRLVTPSVWAKTCRGAMARFLIQENASGRLEGNASSGFPCEMDDSGALQGGASSGVPGGASSGDGNSALCGAVNGSSCGAVNSASGGVGTIEESLEVVRRFSYEGFEYSPGDTQDELFPQFVRP